MPVQKADVWINTFSAARSPQGYVEAAQKVREHYGVELPTSSVRACTSSTGTHLRL